MKNRKDFPNDNGIVRIKENRFPELYRALNGVSEMSNIPVQILFELWLAQVMEGMAQQEISDEILGLAVETYF